MQDSYAHCAQLVRDADRDRYLAALFAPERIRPHLFALYAFNIEIARVRELVHDPLAGEIRLQWWREALDQGGSREETRANPVADALLDTAARCRLSNEPLLELIEARAFDLYNDPMPSLAKFESYARATSSSIIALAGAMLCEGGGDFVAPATHAGIAFAIAGLLRAFPIHARRGQLYIPIDLWGRHGASLDDIFTGHVTPQLRAGLAEMRDLARRHLAELGRYSAQVPAPASSAFLPVALVPSALARMEGPRYDPFRVVELPQWRRQWILWRAASRDFPSS